MAQALSRAEETIAESVGSLERAFRRLGELSRRLARENAAELSEELRPAGWLVLRIAMRSQGISVGDIVQETAMDKSVVSRQLKTLKSCGLVELRRSEDDARVFIVEPTPLAEEKVAAILEKNRAYYWEILAGWDSQDVADLARLITRLTDAIES